MNLASLAGKEILFVQPSLFKNQYQLLLDEEVIGTMAQPRAFSRNAVINLFEKEWEFKRTSFWKSEYGIFPYGYELPVAVFKRKLSGCIIELDKGISFEMKVNLWKRTTEIISMNDRVIITGKKKAGIKAKIILTVNYADSILAENPWLLMLPGFLAINSRRSAAYSG